jgi:myo-inositol-1(or 4)-monophosphatase
MHTEGEYLLGLFADFIRQARAVRRLGSAAIDLAYVAAGRFDGFWEVRLNPWDVSAGALLIEEAGGRVSNLAGGPFDSRLGEVVASNGRIHEQMVEIIRSRNRTN